MKRQPRSKEIRAMKGQFFPALSGSEIDESDSRLILSVAGVLMAGFVVATVLRFGRGPEPSPAVGQRQPPALEQPEAIASTTTNSNSVAVAICGDKRG
jgi:hypothetical protein